MRNINVPLPDEAIERLSQIAQRELRDTRAQAARLILEGIARAERRDRVKAASR